MPLLRRQIRKKQRSYINLAKKTNDRQDWKKFKDVRKASKHKLAEARNNYVLNLLDSPDEVSPPKISKRFWSYFKSTRKDNLGVGTHKSGDTEIVNSEQKAEVLSDQFASVFTDENLLNIPNMDPSTITDIPPVKFDVSGITSLLRNINVKKASGPDNMISCWVLKEAATVIAPFLHYIFTLSMQTGQVTGSLQMLLLRVFKKGNRNEPSNYRSISSTSVPCKIMEHIIYRHIMDHLDSNSILVCLENYQHGFRQGHSCETQLITIIESVTRNLDLGQQSDLLLLDFAILEGIRHGAPPTTAEEIRLLRNPWKS